MIKRWDQCNWCQIFSSPQPAIRCDSSEDVELWRCGDFFVRIWSTLLAHWNFLKPTERILQYPSDYRWVEHWLVHSNWLQVHPHKLRGCYSKSNQFNVIWASYRKTEALRFLLEEDPTTEVAAFQSRSPLFQSKDSPRWGNYVLPQIVTDNQKEFPGGAERIRNRVYMIEFLESMQIVQQGNQKIRDLVRMLIISKYLSTNFVIKLQSVLSLIQPDFKTPENDIRVLTNVPGLRSNVKPSTWQSNCQSWHQSKFEQN